MLIILSDFSAADCRQLAVILGNSLFVHGGIYDEALGQVPGDFGPAASRWMVGFRFVAGSLEDLI
jgi:hypothetical protein